MTRKLLPYEYELIETLGVSKEEYLDFVAQQHIYKDVKEGTQLDIRNWEIVAIVLAVVGILFQVASVLLMPKPKMPQAAEQREGADQTRDQRLSPRLGFNSAQELATYGQTVPIIYTNTNHNSNGGVRVSTMLLWSAILSFGNNQFMRLMMTIAASNIGSIDPERTALGQFPAKDLVFSNVWQYYNANGPTRYNNLLRGSAADPTRTTATDTTAKLNGLPGSIEGFSQAYSPTTANTTGVTGFLPINYDVLVLDSKGNTQRRRVDTSFSSSSGNYWPDNGTRPTVPVGSIWTLIIPNTAENLPSSDTAGNARQDALRASASLIDNGSIFKAGSTLFRVVSATYANSANGLEEANLTVVMECVRAGQMPVLRYGAAHWQELNEERVRLQAQISANITTIGPRAAPTNIFSLDRSADTSLQGQINSIRALPVYELRATGYARGGGTSFSYVPVSSAQIDGRNNQIAVLQTQIANLQQANVNLQNQINNLALTGLAAYQIKGLARVEEAAYASVTKCHILDLALRYQVYRRISGRSNVYGSDQINYEHSASDNGVKARTSMFALSYRFDGTGSFSRLPYIFCCRGVTEQNIFAYLKLVSRNTERFWEIKIEAVIDSYTEIRTFRTRGYCYINPNAPLVHLPANLTEDGSLEVFYNGSLYIDGQRGDYPPLNKSPKDTTEFDLFNYDAFTQTSFSFDSSAEINITAVNEQLLTPWSTYSPTLYQGLSNLALHVVSGSGTQDLRSVSVWVNQGKLLRPISTELNTYGNEATGAINDGAISALAASNASASSSFVPDIFLDTILDRDNGIGKYASLHSVDVIQLAQSKRFCQRNRLFFDGLIADGRPWREFWAQTAPFSLLELGKIGGKDTLVPAVPYDRNTGEITRAVSISALFNQGNILEDSLKEEFIDYGANVQDVIITAIYRDVERNGIFPRNNSVEIRRTDTQESNAIRETLDISQFVTTRAQAIMLGKYLCNTRRYNRRAVEFKTFPTDSFIMPGSFIYLETSMNQWDGIYTGRVEAGGALSVPVASTIPNGTYNVLTYGSTDGTRNFSSIAVTNNTAPALASVAGQLFVLGQAVRSKRVFRITEVTMEEEGETTVRGVEHPCDTSGNSYLSQGLAVHVAGLFTVDGSAE
jgi:hypothetical protein